MPEPADDGWITVTRAAELLGVTLGTVYGLIQRGELAAEVVVPQNRPKRRRSIRVPLQAVDDFLQRARVRPGELRHLHQNWSWERYR